MFRFESVPYPSEYVCQIWLRSDRRECNAGMTIAKCTKTAASSNVSNHLSRTPIARFASGAAHHARPYRNLGRRISLRSYTIVGMTKRQTTTNYRKSPQTTTNHRKKTKTTTHHRKPPQITTRIWGIGSETRDDAGKPPQTTANHCKPPPGALSSASPGRFPGKRETCVTRKHSGAF